MCVWLSSSYWRYWCEPLNLRAFHFPQTTFFPNRWIMLTRQAFCCGMYTHLECTKSRMDGCASYTRCRLTRCRFVPFVACVTVLIYLKRAAAAHSISFAYRSLKSILWTCIQRLRKGFSFVYQSLTNAMASCWQRLKRRVWRRPTPSAELTTMDIRNDDLL